MIADAQHDRSASDPSVARLGRVVVIETAARGVPSVHGVLRRLQRGFVRRQVDLPVVDCGERALLIVVLSRIFFHFYIKITQAGVSICKNGISGIKGKNAIAEKRSNYAKSGLMTGFWRFSFCSICSKSHRNTLVYRQSVVKIVVIFPCSKHVSLKKYRSAVCVCPLV